jgi:hypothetical protein
MPFSVSDNRFKQAYRGSWRVALSPLRYISQWEQGAVKDVAINSSWVIFSLLLLGWDCGVRG